jgi:hypothetical protein
VPISTGPDRSEIGPYLGSPRARSSWPKNPPHPNTSEVGRFLRKRQRKGTWNTVEQARHRHGPLGDRSLPRKSSDYIWVAEKSTSPERLRGGAISPKAPGPQAWNTVEQARQSAGPLGDRSLPRRSSDYIWVAEKPTSPRHLRGGAISPKAPGLQAWNAVEQARHRHGPLGDRSLPRRSSGYIWVLRQTQPHPNTSEVGRFLRKRQVRRHGTP